MSEKIIKFRVSRKAKIAFNIILIASVVLGLGSLVGAIVSATHMPKPATQSYFLDFQEYDSVILSATEGQFLYFAVDTEDDADVILLEYDEYLECIAGHAYSVLDELDVYNGFELKYTIPETGQYVIFVKNYDFGSYASGEISYVVFNNPKALKLIFSLGTVICPILGMVTGLIVAMVSDARNK